MFPFYTTSKNYLNADTCIVSFDSPKGTFYCEWSNVLAAPISPIMEEKKAMRYFTMVLDGEPGDWYLISCREVRNNNLAGPNGETLDIDDLVLMYADNEMLNQIGWERGTTI